MFRSGLVDPALLNAVMLSLAFTANGGVMNKECLIYRGQAIQHIREKISTPDKAVSESTIGAILLLVGVEVRCLCCSLTKMLKLTDQARLGTTSQVQLHMGAIQYLLNACEPVVVTLTQGIKRAIFWSVNVQNSSHSLTLRQAGLELINHGGIKTHSRPYHFHRTGVATRLNSPRLL